MMATEKKMKCRQLMLTGALLAAGVLGGGMAHAAGGVWNYTGAFAGGVGPGNGSGANASNPWISAPAPGSHYAEWNLFNSVPTDATPDIAGAASVTETTGGSFLTGGGNIYSPFVATAFTATLAGGGTGLYDVWLRIETLGELPLAVAKLNDLPGTLTETFSEDTTIVTPGGASTSHEKEWYWKWTVPAASSYEFKFGASAASMSLDQLALYVAPAAAVPEPQTYALFAVGLGLIGVIARRRLNA